MSEVDLLPLILAGVGLLLLTVMFSGTEAAYTSLDERLRKQGLDEDEQRRAAPFGQTLERTRLLFFTLLLGKSLSQLALAGVVLALGVRFESPMPWLGVLTAALLLLPLLLFLGEILPRRVAERYPLPWLRAWRLPLGIVSYVLKPLATPLCSLTASQVTPHPAEVGQEPRNLTEDEVRLLVDRGRTEGTIAAEERELIDKVFEFGDKKVAAIMRDRSLIEFLPDDLGFQELVERLKASRYSRVPIYHGDQDNVVGILYLKDLLPLFLESPRTFVLRDHLRPPHYVPPSQKASVLFREFKTRRIHLAMVVNEYGAIAGLITMEDLLEELFGDIRDEYDDAEWTYDRVSDQAFSVAAAMSLEDFSALIGRSLNHANQDIRTVGGLVLNLFERIPRYGESIVHQDILFRVQEVHGTRLRKIYAELQPPPVPQEGAVGGRT
ncbi:MAG: hypothetical protein A2284_16630 [Deltaproteobacteria bacterium RIFOXYA12_FULL_61_11]|nr:MAG: hypothetical protein A2284_16630 [Deltaproteobacteria bacterium RIFOXYA12_FULL_61_11]